MPARIGLCYLSDESKESMNKGLQRRTQEIWTEMKIKLLIQGRIGHVMITSPDGRKSA